MANPNFIRTKGTKIEIALVPDGVATATDSAAVKALLEGITDWKRVRFTDAAPSPDGSRPIEPVDTIDEGQFSEVGDETRATMTFGVLATTNDTASIASYKMIRDAYHPDIAAVNSLVYRRIDPVIAGVATPAKVCVVHVGSAVENTPINGRKTMAVTMAVQGDTFDIEIAAT